MVYLLLYFWSIQKFDIFNPQPLKPGATSVSGNTAQFTNAGWVCQLRVLNKEQFLEQLKALGINETQLSDPKIGELLGKLALFQVAFKNTGEEPLVFNPDQVILRNPGSVVGRQMGSLDWISSSASAQSGLRQIARLFNRSTIEIGPGQVKTRLLAFKPLSPKFPKKMTLVVNHLYYGIKPSPLECQFETRYSKR